MSIKPEEELVVNEQAIEAGKKRWLESREKTRLIVKKLFE
jgi:hypothetical protein